MNYIYFVVCKCFQFHTSKILSFAKDLTLIELYCDGQCASSCFLDNKIQSFFVHVDKSNPINYFFLNVEIAELKFLPSITVIFNLIKMYSLQEINVVQSCS